MASKGEFDNYFLELPPPAPMVLTPAQCYEVDSRIDSRHVQQVHDGQVEALINQTLRTYHNQWNTVAENLDLAQSAVEDDRKKNGADTVMRDAEYYLKVRAWTAVHKRKSVKLIFGTGWVYAALVWNGLKCMVDPFFPAWTQSNKGNPNAKPGGLEWAIKGAQDGMWDNGAQMGAARAARFGPDDE